MKHLILTIFGWKRYNNIHELKELPDFKIKTSPDCVCRYINGRIHYWDNKEELWKQHSVNFVPYIAGYYKLIQPSWI